jgi:hypothetical protein
MQNDLQITMTYAQLKAFIKASVNLQISDIVENGGYIESAPWYAILGEFAKRLDSNLNFSPNEQKILSTFFFNHNLNQLTNGKTNKDGEDAEDLKERRARLQGIERAKYYADAIRGASIQAAEIRRKTGV